MGCFLSTKIKHTDYLSSSIQTGSGDLCRKVPSPRIPLNLRTELEILDSSNLKCFSFQELRAATREFRPDSILGEGGFGCVFKGWIDEETLTPARPNTGLVIAVKKLNKDAFQGHHQWLAEINYLGQLHHPNLAKLIGYCSEEEHRLLVYEFMSRGSLDHHLFMKKSSSIKPLSWKLRVKIALDAAKGLAFLHDQKVKVIYRDFKSANILVDSDYTGKLSDFGLAKDGPITDEKSYVSTRVLGTHGYAAPEYMATGHLSTKSDVYSFGVVLLEIMTGRRALDPKRSAREENLVSWARPYLKNKRKLFRIMDSKIEGQYPSNAAVTVGRLAIRCLSVDPRFRPTMNQIVTELEVLRGNNSVSIGLEQQESHQRKSVSTMPRNHRRAAVTEEWGKRVDND